MRRDRRLRRQAKFAGIPHAAIRQHRSHANGSRFVRVWRDRKHQEEMRGERDEKRRVKQKD